MTTIVINNLQVGSSAGATGRSNSAEAEQYIRGSGKCVRRGVSALVVIRPPFLTKQASDGPSEICVG